MESETCDISQCKNLLSAYIWINTLGEIWNPNKLILSEQAIKMTRMNFILILKDQESLYLMNQPYRTLYGFTVHLFARRLLRLTEDFPLLNFSHFDNTIIMVLFFLNLKLLDMTGKRSILLSRIGYYHSESNRCDGHPSFDHNILISSLWSNVCFMLNVFRIQNLFFSLQLSAAFG